MELEKFSSTRDLQDLLALRSDIEQLSLERFGSQAGAALDPKLDLLDLGSAYRLIVEVPGVSQDNLEIALQGRNLTVAGLREPVYDGLGDGMVNSVDVVMSERANGHFQRSVELPGEVDYDSSHASLQGGLLVLDLPKA